MAVRKRIIEVNPFKYVEVKTTVCRPQTKNASHDRVFLPEDKAKFFSKLESIMVERKELTTIYAINILFKLGLRIGEVVALRYSDIDHKMKEIHIQRMETKVLDEDNMMVSVIVNHTKKKSKHGDRFLPLSDYELKVFETVKKSNFKYGYNEEDFIFCNEHGRLSTSTLDYWIRRICREADITTKSAHDIRRSVASEMYNKGVPIEVIRDYLGHSCTSTTWGYIYDNLGKEQTNRIIIESLKEMNVNSGLKRTQYQ